MIRYTEDLGSRRVCSETIIIKIYFVIPQRVEWHGDQCYMVKTYPLGIYANNKDKGIDRRRLIVDILAANLTIKSTF